MQADIVERTQGENAMLLSFRFFSLLFVLLFATAGLVLGQLDRGAITGIVSDQTGAVIANARVTVTKQDTNVQTDTTTTQTGLFTIPSLLVGQYRVQLEASGFKVSVQD